MSYRIINPVLAGFYPAPSVCVSGGKLFMVTESFTYFPGLPLFTSKNGVGWNQLGNIISSGAQLDMSGQGIDKRLMSPTLRFDSSFSEKGRFYCVANQPGGLGIFLCFSDEPASWWSNPVHIDGAHGYDPSIFFDDDGTVWYCGVREATEDKFYESQSEVYLQRIDLESARLYGEQKIILKSDSRRTGWIEGPHIFKKDGIYYLLYSEGGLGLNHGISIARSEKICEDWEIREINPIFTHRNMGLQSKIVSVGHGDMYCDKDGRWWIALCACRPYGDKLHRFINMDRETFIVPVRWEEGWPVIAPETGKIENAYSLSGGVVKRSDDDADAVIMPVVDDFNENEIKPYWLTNRAFCDNLIRWDEVSGMLRLYGGAPIQSEENLAMIVRRQTSFCYEACTQLTCHFANQGDCAGIICYQNEKCNLRLQYKYLGMVIAIQFIRSIDGNEEVVKEEIIGGGTNEYSGIFRIVAEKQLLKFEFGADERSMSIFASDVDSSFLSPDKSGGHSGVTVGMFAIAGGDFKLKQFCTDFDWFKYENITREFTS